MDLKEELLKDCEIAMNLANEADEQGKDFVMVDINLLYRLASNLALLLVGEQIQQCQNCKSCRFFKMVDNDGNEDGMCFYYGDFIYLTAKGCDNWQQKEGKWVV